MKQLYFHLHSKMAPLTYTNDVRCFDIEHLSLLLSLIREKTASTSSRRTIYLYPSRHHTVASDAFRFLFSTNNLELSSGLLGSLTDSSNVSLLAVAGPERRAKPVSVVISEAESGAGKV